jgi:hypothetical protein
MSSVIAARAKHGAFGPETEPKTCNIELGAIAHIGKAICDKLNLPDRIYRPTLLMTCFKAFLNFVI